jgi:hypothetical protein
MLVCRYVMTCNTPERQEGLTLLTEACKVQYHVNLLASYYKEIDKPYGRIVDPNPHWFGKLDPDPH